MCRVTVDLLSSQQQQVNMSKTHVVVNCTLQSVKAIDRVVACFDIIVSASQKKDCFVLLRRALQFKWKSTKKSRHFLKVSSIRSIDVVDTFLILLPIRTTVEVGSFLLFSLYCSFFKTIISTRCCRRSGSMFLFLFLMADIVLKRLKKKIVWLLIYGVPQSGGENWKDKKGQESRQWNIISGFK